jgi:hypothetical protein
MPLVDTDRLTAGVPLRDVVTAPGSELTSPRECTEEPRSMVLETGDLVELGVKVSRQVWCWD